MSPVPVVLTSIRPRYKVCMKLLVGIAMLLFWLGAGAYSREAPELGSFAEEPAGLKIKGIKPGPRMREILKGLYENQLDVLFKTLKKGSPSSKRNTNPSNKSYCHING